MVALCLCVHPNFYPSYVHLAMFSFLNDDFSKYEWILPQLIHVYAFIVEIWLGLANGQISIFDRVISSLHNSYVLLFRVFIVFKHFSFL